MVYDKGIDILIEAAKILVNRGFDISWKVIGDSSQRMQFEKSLRAWGGEKYVTFLGTMINPYPYIANCDIYVQPSRTEGWGIAITEAKILEKPIVASDIDVFKEQIISEKNGITVSLTPENLCNGIIKLINNSDLVSQIKNNLKQEKLGNEGEVEKIYELLTE